MAEETFEGYLMDVECIRTKPRGDLGKEAEKHTRECALMGHCMESGYGLVDDDGRVLILESEITPDVVEIIEATDRERGIRLRVNRQEEDGEMRTTHVEEVSRR